MKNFKNVKAVKLQVVFNGDGCVNFDGPEQVYELRGLGLLNGMSYDNVKYAKKVYKNITNKEGEDKVGFKYKVSSECIGNGIFKDTIPFQNQNLTAVKYSLYNAITHPDMLMRGYLYTIKGGIPFKRKSPFTLTDAIEVGDDWHDSLAFDFHSNSGEKSKLEDEEVTINSTSIYRCENVGQREYEAKAILDLCEMQFISDDCRYDRTNCGGLERNSEYEKLFLDALSSRFGHECKFNYYYMAGGCTEDEWGEKGVLLTKEDVDMMVKRTIKNILNTKIYRRHAFLETKSVNMVVYYGDGGKSEMIEITSENVDDFTFEYFPKYVQSSEEKILECQKMLEKYQSETLDKAKKNKGSKKGDKKGEKSEE